MKIIQVNYSDSILADKDEKVGPLGHQSLANLLLVFPGDQENKDERVVLYRGEGQLYHDELGKGSDGELLAVIHVFLIFSVDYFWWDRLNAYVAFDATCHERKGSDVDQYSKSHDNAAIPLDCARIASFEYLLNIGIEVNVHDTSQLEVSNREVGDH